jgi:hypothetical protein
MKDDHEPMTKPKDDHEPLTKGKPKKEKALIFESPFGQVIFYTDHPAQPVFVRLPGEEPRRVRGNEKRLLITLLAAVKSARCRPLPRAGQN